VREEAIGPLLLVCVEAFDDRSDLPAAPIDCGHFEFVRDSGIEPDLEPGALKEDEVAARAGHAPRLVEVRDELIRVLCADVVVVAIDRVVI
jgi:hypothetical protein